jgi:hypothetical protein
LTEESDKSLHRKKKEITGSSLSTVFRMQIDLQTWTIIHLAGDLIYPAAALTEPLYAFNLICEA